MIPAILTVRRLDEAGVGVRDQQTCVRNGEEWIGRCRHIRCKHVRHSGALDDVRQLHPAQIAILSGRDEPRIGKRANGLPNLRVQDYAFAVVSWLLLVVLLVVRRELLDGDGGIGFECCVKSFPRMIGVACTSGQRLRVEPLEEQKVEISTRKKARHGRSRDLMQLAQQLRRWRDIGVLLGHVEQIHRVRGCASVVHAFFRNDDAEIV